MSFEEFLTDIQSATKTEDGAAVADALSLRALPVELDLSFEHDVKNAVKDRTWAEVVTVHLKAKDLLVREDLNDAYEGQVAVVQAVLKGCSAGWERWILPVLYTVCRDLRWIAIESDKQSGKTENLESTAQVLNRAFTACITDRASLDESRKWGTYVLAALLFKIYFRLNKLSLCKNVLRAVDVSELPELEEYGRGEVCTWKYYLGVIAFLNEDYKKAATELTGAFDLCLSTHTVNQTRILTYLIPTNLLLSEPRLPSTALFEAFPELKRLYEPIVDALRLGRLGAYDNALANAETDLVKTRAYLTVERARAVCVRNLLRRTWLLSEKSSRMEINTFAAAVNFSLREAALESGGNPEQIDAEEVECELANQIYRGAMKGYISREKGMVVLSAKDAFPKSANIIV
ncbi:hypothetical protein G7K_0936-t1 [Saitoella complicata NRRL Y-17804]|uniref:PCI domain-containing protein n=2 Tax=Saitoella complicata (strain BCRC 22490 / CBS 7301 / JCM 7358 / NBRC 10748 / NRRL Y-17804) TaxID=698492 RepID=A0A0E9NA57_SAICN|nr:hypothetical protein G7K_0936-t1 [Saitoella complicata NRRL Y-17804]